MTSTSPIDRIIKWRKENPEEADRVRIKGLRSSQKAKDAACMVSRKYKKERLASRAKNPRMQAGEKHCSARTWFLKSPRGITYTAINLALFVREHKELFSKEDATWIKKKAYRKGGRYNGMVSHCNASNGLRSLCPYKRDGSEKKHYHGSWKGWTWDG